MIRLVGSSITNLRNRIRPQFTFSVERRDESDVEEVFEITPEQEMDFQKWLNDEQAQKADYAEPAFFVPIELLKESVKEFNASKVISVFDSFKVTSRFGDFNKPVYTDHEQQLKIQISVCCNNLLKNTDIVDNITQIESILSQQFQLNHFTVILQKDFQFILQNKHTQSLLKLFYNRSFFLANPTFLSNLEISNMMTRFEKSPTQFGLSLGLIKFHRNFLEPGAPQQNFLGVEQAEIFLKKHVNERNFNFLNFAYHLNKLTPKNILKSLDQKELVKQILTLSINKSESFRKQSSELLLQTFKIDQHEGLRALLFDLFFCSARIERGYASISLFLCLLARLSQKKPHLQDIFHIMQQYFSTSFEPYFVKWMPIVLQALSDKSFLRHYEVQLSQYLTKKQDDPLKLITEMDNFIFQKRCVFGQDQEQGVIIGFQGGKFRFESDDLDTPILLRKENIKKAFIEKDYKLLALLLQETFSQEPEWANKKISLDNNKDKIKDILYNLKPDLEEMMDFEENPRIYYQDKQRDNVDSLEPNERFKFQVKQNPAIKIFHTPNIMTKQRFSFCSNQFKDFLNKAKQIDANRPTTLTDQEVKELKHTLNVEEKLDKNNVLDTLLQKCSTPGDQQELLENLLIKKEDIQYLQKLCSSMLASGRGSLFYHLFFQSKQKSMAQLEDPNLICDLKNYNEYLVGNIIDFQLPLDCYIFLLRQCEQNYNKKSFKKILAHYLKYSPVVENPEIITKVVSLCSNQKLSETLFEFSKRIKLINFESLQILLPALARYKNHQPLVVELLKNHLDHHPLTFTAIQTYIKELMNLSQPELCMNMFEKLKLHTMNRKFKSTKELNSEEIIELQAQQKTQNATQIKEFYTAFTSYLNSQKLFTQARLCFQDQLSNKTTQMDYRVFFLSKAFKEDPLSQIKIIGHMEANSPSSVDIEVLGLVLTSMLELKEQKGYGEFFEKIVKEYVLQKNIALTVSSVNLILKGFIIYPKSTLLAEFFKWLQNETLALTSQSKILSYKALQSDPEESSKSYLKGIIDSIFSDENTQVSIQKKKEKKQVQQVAASESKSHDNDIVILKRIMSHQISAMDAIFNRKGKRKYLPDRTPGWEKFQDADEELGIKNLRERK